MRLVFLQGDVQQLDKQTAFLRRIAGDRPAVSEADFRTALAIMRSCRLPGWSNYHGIRLER